MSSPTVTARRAQTRDRLMTAAAAVFAERGIIGASVEQICEAAGFTRGAFYSNFASKDELVLALLRSYVEAQWAAARRAINSLKQSEAVGRDPAEAVSTALAAFESDGPPGREWILTQQELLLYAARRPEVRAPYLAFSESYTTQFGTLIGEGLQAARLEFSISFDDALGLLTACHQQDHVEALLYDRAPDNSRLRTLLAAITRPA